MPDETATEGYSLEKTKSDFSSAHPEADISIAKKEGNAFYVEGWNGNILYKMKFLVENGSVVLDKTITTGRQ